MTARQTHRWLLWFWLAVIAICPTVSSWAFDELLRAKLIEGVTQEETRFTDFSAEISAFTWSDAERTSIESTEFRRILQWQGRLYECVCSNSPNSKSNTTAFRFNWTEGKKATIYSPPGEVKIYQGEDQSNSFFRPYDILLHEIGFDGGLREYLKVDGKTMDAWRLELAADADFPDDPTIVSLRAERKLPGSKFASIMELRLSTQHGYLPVWGRSLEIEGETRHVRVVAEVTDFVETGDCGPVMRQMQVSTFTGDADELVNSRVFEFQGERLKEPPSDDYFQAISFVGNPQVTRYEDGREVSKGTYRPIPVKKPEPWPPFTIWLIMNDIIIVLIGTVLLIRMVIQRVFSPVLRRSEI